MGLIKYEEFYGPEGNTGIVFVVSIQGQNLAIPLVYNVLLGWLVGCKQRILLFKPSIFHHSFSFLISTLYPMLLSNYK